MAVGTYKFRGVPKTFQNRASAIIFLQNSPGYVQRQSAYLQEFWPGLSAELGVGAPKVPPVKLDPRIAAQRLNTQTAAPANPTPASPGELAQIRGNVIANQALQGLRPTIAKSAQAAPSALQSGLAIGRVGNYAPAVLGLPYKVTDVRHPVRAYQAEAAKKRQLEEQMKEATLAGDQERLNSLTRQAARQDMVLVNPVKGAARLVEGRLTPQEERVAAQASRSFAKALKANPTQLVQRYQALPETHGGRLIDTDIARELSPHYRRSPSLAPHVHDTASAVAKLAYEAQLARPVDETPLVVLRGGGAGAGKSTVAPLLDGAITYDTTLSDLASAKSKVDAALASGRSVEIHYVYRDPAEAARGAAQRATETGRTVSADAFVRTHLESNKVIRQIAETYKDDPRVQISVTNNSLPGSPEVGLSGLPETTYNGVRDAANAHIAGAVPSGEGGAAQGGVSQVGAGELSAGSSEVPAPGTEGLPGRAQAAASRLGEDTGSFSPFARRGFVADEPPASAAVPAGEAAGPQTLNETVQSALQGAPEAIAAQNAAYRPERAIRAKGAMKTYYDAGGGTAGRLAARGELKGPLPVVEWNGLKDLTPETVDAMTRQIFEGTHDLQYYDMENAAAGLERVLQGRPPAQHQLLLLNRVFPKSTVDSLTVADNRARLARLYQAGVQTWNIPRTIMASYDLSAPFRQGLVSGSRHPIIFARNFKPMLKAFGSQRLHDEIMHEIPTRENFERYGKMKLDVGVRREEQFPNSYVDNVPGVKGSSRAYSAFLVKQRADVADRMIAIAAKHNKNIDDPRFLEALGTMINNSTGRGRIPLKHGEAAAEFLNTFLFSPRLLSSRFHALNPFYYGRLWAADPWLARQALYEAGSTIVAIATMVELASHIPGAKVGLNPFSSDFGKVRIGDTRIDFAGGFQPLIVLYSRFLFKKSVSSSSGKEQDINGDFGHQSRPDLVYRFFQSKLAPSPRAIYDYFQGQTYVGDPVTAKGMAWNNLTPLGVQQAYETAKTEGNIPAGAAAFALGGVGFGVGSYPDTPAKTGGNWRSGGSSANDWRSGGSSANDWRKP